VPSHNCIIGVLNCFGSRELNNRIGIIGDVHSENLRLERAIDFLIKNQVDLVICTGDIADGRGDINKSCELLRTHCVVCVRGNHDRWLLNNQARDIPDAHCRNDLTQETISFLEGLAVQERVELPDGELLLCHGVLDRDMDKIWPGTDKTRIERSKALDELLLNGPPRIIVNGHMHYRTLIDFMDCIVINAGSLKGDHAAISILDIRADLMIGYSIKDDSIEQLGTASLSNKLERKVWANTQDFDGDWVPITLN